MSIAGSLDNLVTRALIARSPPRRSPACDARSLTATTVSEIISEDRGACHASDRARPAGGSPIPGSVRVVLLKPLITSPLIEVGEV
jgi:hypothetical protein